MHVRPRASCAGRHHDMPVILIRFVCPKVVQGSGTRPTCRPAPCSCSARSLTTMPGRPRWQIADGAPTGGLAGDSFGRDSTLRHARFLLNFVDRDQDHGAKPALCLRIAPSRNR